LPAWMTPVKLAAVCVRAISTRITLRSTSRRRPEAASTCAIRTLKSDVTSGASVTSPRRRFFHHAGRQAGMEDDVVVTRFRFGYARQLVRYRAMIARTSWPGTHGDRAADEQSRNSQRRIYACSACSAEQGPPQKGGPHKRTGKFLLLRNIQ